MITWVVQENMAAEETVKELETACNMCDSYFPIKLVPFSNELLELPEGKKIYWGTTTLQKLVYPDNGLFFDPDKFLMEKYLDHWGDNMLNLYADIVELRELAELEGYPGPWFVRPNDDSKSFCGQLMEWEDIKEWLGQVSRYDNDGLNLNTKIMIGKPLNLMDEIRCFIVNGTLITASFYRKNKKLCYQRVNCCREIDCLFCELWEFVFHRCEEYMPAGAFVMDIATYPGYDSMYVIEAGCINCAGFYDCDIPMLVGAMSEYRESLP